MVRSKDSQEEALNMFSTHRACSTTLDGEVSAIENRASRIEAVLRYVSQRFCDHHWIWHFREMECSKCLRRYSIDASFLTATGPYTDTARAAARQQRREIDSEQQAVHFKEAKSCG
jgi:hypothetical protein